MKFSGNGGKTVLGLAFRYRELDSALTDLCSAETSAQDVIDSLEQQYSIVLFQDVKDGMDEVRNYASNARCELAQAELAIAPRDHDPERAYVLLNRVDLRIATCDDHCSAAAFRAAELAIFVSGGGDLDTLQDMVMFMPFGQALEAAIRDNLRRTYLRRAYAPNTVFHSITSGDTLSPVN